MHIPGARKGHLAERLSEAFPPAYGLIMPEQSYTTGSYVRADRDHPVRASNRPGYTSMEWPKRDLDM
jgi:hypothetical protein